MAKPGSSLRWSGPRRIGGLASRAEGRRSSAVLCGLLGTVLFFGGALLLGLAVVRRVASAWLDHVEQALLGWVLGVIGATWAAYLLAGAMGYLSGAAQAAL